MFVCDVCFVVCVIYVWCLGEICVVCCKYCMGMLHLHCVCSVNMVFDVCVCCMFGVCWYICGEGVWGIPLLCMHMVCGVVKECCISCMCGVCGLTFRYIFVCDVWCVFGIYVVCV